MASDSEEAAEIARQALEEGNDITSTVAELESELSENEAQSKEIPTTEDDSVDSMIEVTPSIEKTIEETTLRDLAIEEVDQAVRDLASLTNRSFSSDDEFLNCDAPSNFTKNKIIDDSIESDKQTSLETISNITDTSKLLDETVPNVKNGKEEISEDAIELDIGDDDLKCSEEEKTRDTMEERPLQIVEEPGDDREEKTEQERPVTPGANSHDSSDDFDKIAARKTERKREEKTEDEDDKTEEGSTRPVTPGTESHDDSDNFAAKKTERKEEEKTEDEDGKTEEGSTRTVTPAADSDSDNFDKIMAKKIERKIIDSDSSEKLEKIKTKKKKKKIKHLSDADNDTDDFENDISKFSSKKHKDKKRKKEKDKKKSIKMKIKLPRRESTDKKKKHSSRTPSLDTDDENPHVVSLEIPSSSASFSTEMDSPKKKGDSKDGNDKGLQLSEDGIAKQWLVNEVQSALRKKNIFTARALDDSLDQLLGKVNVHLKRWSAEEIAEATRRRKCVVPPLAMPANYMNPKTKFNRNELMKPELSKHEHKKRKRIMEEEDDNEEGDGEKHVKKRKSSHDNEHKKKKKQRVKSTDDENIIKVKKSSKDHDKSKSSKSNENEENTTQTINDIETDIPGIEAIVTQSVIDLLKLQYPDKTTGVIPEAIPVIETVEECVTSMETDVVVDSQVPSTEKVEKSKETPPRRKSTPEPPHRKSTPEPPHRKPSPEPVAKRKSSPEPVAKRKASPEPVAKRKASPEPVAKRKASPEPVARRKPSPEPLSKKAIAESSRKSTPEPPIKKTKVPIAKAEVPKVITEAPKVAPELQKYKIPKKLVDARTELTERPLRAAQAAMEASKRDSFRKLPTIPKRRLPPPPKIRFSEKSQQTDPLSCLKNNDGPSVEDLMLLLRTQIKDNPVVLSRWSKTPPVAIDDMIRIQNQFKSLRTDMKPRPRISLDAYKKKMHIESRSSSEMSRDRDRSRERAYRHADRKDSEKREYDHKDSERRKRRDAMRREIERKAASRSESKSTEPEPEPNDAPVEYDDGEDAYSPGSSTSSMEDENYTTKNIHPDRPSPSKMMEEIEAKNQIRERQSNLIVDHCLPKNDADEKIYDDTPSEPRGPVTPVRPKSPTSPPLQVAAVTGLVNPFLQPKVPTMKVKPVPTTPTVSPVPTTPTVSPVPPIQKPPDDDDAISLHFNDALSVVTIDERSSFLPPTSANNPFVKKKPERVTAPQPPLPVTAPRIQSPAMDARNTPPRQQNIVQQWISKAAPTFQQGSASSSSTTSLLNMYNSPTFNSPGSSSSPHHQYAPMMTPPQMMNPQLLAMQQQQQMNQSNPHQLLAMQQQQQQMNQSNPQLLAMQQQQQQMNQSNPQLLAMQQQQQMNQSNPQLIAMQQQHQMNQSNPQLIAMQQQQLLYEQQQMLLSQQNKLSLQQQQEEEEEKKLALQIEMRQQKEEEEKKALQNRQRLLLIHEEKQRLLQLELERKQLIDKQQEEKRQKMLLQNNFADSRSQLQRTSPAINGNKPKHVERETNDEAFFKQMIMEDQPIPPNFLRRPCYRHLQGGRGCEIMNCNFNHDTPDIAYTMGRLIPIEAMQLYLFVRKKSYKIFYSEAFKALLEKIIEYSEIRLLLLLCYELIHREHEIEHYWWKQLIQALICLSSTISEHNEIEMKNVLIYVLNRGDCDNVLRSDIAQLSIHTFQYMPEVLDAIFSGRNYLPSEDIVLQLVDYLVHNKQESWASVGIEILITPVSEQIWRSFTPELIQQVAAMCSETVRQVLLKKAGRSKQSLLPPPLPPQSLLEMEMETESPHDDDNRPYSPSQPAGKHDLMAPDPDLSPRASFLKVVTEKPYNPLVIEMFNNLLKFIQAGRWGDVIGVITGYPKEKLPRGRCLYNALREQLNRPLIGFCNIVRTAEISRANAEGNMIQMLPDSMVNLLATVGINLLMDMVDNEQYNDATQTLDIVQKMWDRLDLDNITSYRMHPITHSKMLLRCATMFFKTSNIADGYRMLQIHQTKLGHTDSNSELVEVLELLISPMLFEKRFMDAVNLWNFTKNVKWNHCQSVNRNYEPPHGANSLMIHLLNNEHFDLADNLWADIREYPHKLTPRTTRAVLVHHFHFNKDLAKDALKAGKLNSTYPVNMTNFRPHTIRLRSYLTVEEMSLIIEDYFMRMDVSTDSNLIEFQVLINIEELDEPLPTRHDQPMAMLPYVECHLSSASQRAENALNLLTPPVVGRRVQSNCKLLAINEVSLRKYVRERNMQQFQSVRDTGSMDSREERWGRSSCPPLGYIVH